MKREALILLAAVLLAGPLTVHATPVVVGDKEWRQLSETAGLFSWNQVAQNCGSSNGTCEGSISGVSVEGWTWASVLDIQTLFNTLVPRDPLAFAAVNTASLFLELTSTEYRKVVDEFGFAPTSAPTSAPETRETIYGLTRSETSGDIVRGIAPRLEDHSSTGAQACLRCAQSKTATVSHMGVWLYREAVLKLPESPTLPGQELPGPPVSEPPAHAVPQPASWALMIAGMLGLWGLRRRRSARQPKG